MIIAGLGRRLGALAAAAILTVAVAPGAPVLAQPAKSEATEDLAKKKAAMLEMFLASKRLSAALLSRRETAGPLVERARVHLDAGWEALSAGDPVRAAGQFDKGISAVSAAIAMAGQKRAPSGDQQARANANRRREAHAYLDALRRAKGLSGDDRQRIEALNAQLAKADDRLAAGDEAGASRIVTEIYPQIVSLVSHVQRGQTAFVSKTFDTPEEALVYERARNENHRVLVQLALAERARFQPGLDSLAAHLSTLSEKLRDEAEAHAAANRIVDAVDTMQKSTERLSAILRAAGLIMTESDANR